MSILLSVNPPFAGWLVDGEKTIEWRKKPLHVGKAYIYETKKNGGCGMVIGEVFIGDNWGFSRELFGSINEALLYLRRKNYRDSVVNQTLEATEDCVKRGKVSKEELLKYAKGKVLYANNSLDFKRYDKPIPLSDFMRPCTFKSACPLCKLWSPVDIDRCNRERTITRPPQSWCYCEDLKGETK